MVKDEIENLFVRLNAGGTPLRGEELNYSILKAHLSPAVQNEVESACQTLIRPARFIILAYRLFLVKDKPNAEAPSMSIQPKQFQRAIADAKTLQDFELFLKQLLTKCIHEEKPLLLTIKDMLSFDAKLNPHAFPYLVLRRITNDAPELMFILLYRFWVKGDQFVKDDDKHRMALGMLSLLLFFGKQDKQRDYRSLFNGIWHCVSKFDQNTFWSNATVYRAVSLDVLPTIPAYKETPKQKGLESIKSLKFTVKSNFFAKIDQNQEGKIKAFTEKMFVNRDLLLYAQRHFLSEYFQEEQFLLENTNVPFDWDHLFSQQNIRYKKGIQNRNPSSIQLEICVLGLMN
ncbi:MAG: hypothetical protein IPO07_08740 [Haliscomenobacter sp.]|nr:hypothetical protein [Haliscomenobacter sp.]MBK9488864.1 hypothetical protein [Haliscomenobacter sp.]